MVGAPIASGVYVIAHERLASTQLVAPKLPLSELLNVTRPLGTVLPFEASVTVAVQVVALPTTAGLGVQSTEVTVLSPELTATAPVVALRMNAPEHDAPPGIQSLTFELVEALARVWPWMPISVFALPSTPNAVSGNAASIEIACPLLHAA